MNLKQGIIRSTCLSVYLIAATTMAAFAEENPHGMDLKSVTAQNTSSGAGSPIDGLSSVLMIVVMFVLLTASLTIAARISKSHFNRK